MDRKTCMHFIAQLAVNVTEGGRCTVERGSSIHIACIELCCLENEKIPTIDSHSAVKRP